MKTATITELRYQFAKISHWLESGLEVIVTRRGIPYARLIPKPQFKAAKRN